MLQIKSGIYNGGQREEKRGKGKEKKVRKRREMLSRDERQEYACSLPDLNAETCPNANKTRSSL